MVLLLLVVRGAFCLCAHWLVRGKPWLAVRVIAWEELGNKEDKLGNTRDKVGKINT